MPDRSHLIVVSDNGKIFFLNLLDYNSGHCTWENNKMFNDNTDFEDVAIVDTEWSRNNKIAYDTLYTREVTMTDHICTSTR